jgi:hypothetical protein
MRRVYDGLRQYDSLADNECTPLWDDGELGLNQNLRFAHAGTHARCAVSHGSRRTLIAGDCIEAITRIRFVARSFEPVAAVSVLGVSSVWQLHAYSPTLVYGGTRSIHDFEELFHRYFRAVQQRQSQVIGEVKKDGVTAWEVSRLMFPEADDARFLAVSEAAHLDLAHSEGWIEAEGR